MKDLPEKFQMRTFGFPGFTHTVKMNGWGDYEVTWARGFERKSFHMDGRIPNKTFYADEVKKLVKNCEWFVIENKPKQEEELPDRSASLPDEFYWESFSYKYKAEKSGDKWRCYLNGYKDGSGGIFGQEVGDGPYSEDVFVKNFKKGCWKILDKKPLTAEQQKLLKEFKEQIFQLDNNIRIQEQSIEHYNRMIANYKGRQDDLRKKIEEMEWKV